MSHRHFREPSCRTRLPAWWLAVALVGGCALPGGTGGIGGAGATSTRGTGKGLAPAKASSPAKAASPSPAASPSAPGTPAPAGTADPPPASPSASSAASASPTPAPPAIGTPQPGATPLGAAAVLQAKLVPKLELVSRLAFTQGRAALVSNNGSGLVTEGGAAVVANAGGRIIANNGGGIIANNGGGIIANNGGAYRLAGAAVASPGAGYRLSQAAGAASPTPIPTLSATIAVTPQAGETLVARRTWAAGDRLLEFHQGGVDADDAVRWVELTAANQPIYQKVDVAEVRFADRTRQVDRFEHLALAADGAFRYQRKDRQTKAPDGKGVKAAFLPRENHFRMPELGVMLDIDEFELDVTAGTGRYVYHYPLTDTTETGALRDVAPGADGKLMFSTGDALGYYSGDSEVRDAAGALLFRKSRQVSGTQVSRGYDLGDGLVMDLQRVDEGGKRFFRGVLNDAGQKVADVKLVFAGDGTTVFDLTYLDPPGATTRIGWGTAAEAGAGATPAPRPAWTVQTVAGGMTSGYVDGDAVSSRLSSVRAIAASRVHPDRWYLAELGNQRVRTLTRTAGGWVVGTYAGSGATGDGDGPADQASFRSPIGLAVGPDDTLYVAELDGHRVRRIAAGADGKAGAVSVLAGNPAFGYLDGTLADAKLYAPTALALVGDRLFVTEQGNDCVRAIDLAAGQVATWAGRGPGPTRDGAGDQAVFRNPLGLTLGDDGALFTVESQVVRRVDVAGPSHAVTTFAGTGLDADGFFDGPKGASGLYAPQAIAPDGAGGFFVASRDVRHVHADGAITSVAGAVTKGVRDGTDKDAQFVNAWGLARLADGALLVSDAHRVRLLTPPAAP